MAAPPTLEVQTVNLQPLAVDAAKLGELLGISVYHVRRLMAREQLPAPQHLGRAARWNLAEIQAWLNAGSPDRKKWECLKR